MRIYDEQNDKQLSSVTIYLAPAEAAELGSDAVALSENPNKHHSHISDENGERKITLAVYTQSNLGQFDENSRKIIEGD